MPVYSVTDGNQRDTKAHIFKIIYAPVFIDLKYIHGFQSSASIMKQKTETNFPESQISDISYSQMQQACTCQICQYCAGPQSPTVCTGRQNMCKHADFIAGRGFKVLWIKSCGEEDFHQNKKQTKESSSENSHYATLLPKYLGKDN